MLYVWLPSLWLVQVRERARHRTSSRYLKVSEKSFGPRRARRQHSVGGDDAASCKGKSLHGVASLSCSNKAPKRGKLHQTGALPPGVMDGEDDEENCPWEGAIVFKRSAVQTRFEYETSLERLGLSRLSSELSRSLASSMGLKTVVMEGEASSVTPVGISIDVSREGRDLRLDGITRTAIALCCNRCLAPVAERVFASFSLLLTVTPVTEPVQQTVGVVLGGRGQFGIEAEDEQGDVELDLDLDDKLHFPSDTKEIDISKYLRDTVHLEVPAKSLCEVSCKGFCLDCGVNLNKVACKCGNLKKMKNEGVWGPLEQLKRQMEDQQGNPEGPHPS